MSAVSIPTRLAALPRDAVLRLALKLDAVVTGVNGVAYLAAAEPLEELLGLPPDLVRPLGAFLVVFAAAVWFTATRPAVARAAVLAVALANVAWAVGSIGSWRSACRRRPSQGASGSRSRPWWWARSRRSS